MYRSKKREDAVRISWFLLIICLLDCAAWTVGVLEQPAQEYFVGQNRFLGQIHLSSDKVAFQSLAVQVAVYNALVHQYSLDTANNLSFEENRTVLSKVSQSIDRKARILIYLLGLSLSKKQKSKEYVAEEASIIN